MSCCTIDLGAYPHNKDVNTGLIATVSGVYKAILFFAGLRITRPFNGISGQPLIIPRPFNESYVYKLEIYKPDGSLVSSEGCTNFTFKTYVSIDITCDECNCDEEDFIYA